MPIPTSEILNCSNCDKRLSGECIQGNERYPLKSFLEVVRNDRQMKTEKAHSILDMGINAITRDAFIQLVRTQRQYIGTLPTDARLSIECYLAKTDLENLDRSLR